MTDQQAKAQRIYNDRCEQILREGYFLKKISIGNNIDWVRLVHINGNVVTIFYDKKDCTVFQRTNGRLVWQYH